MKQVLKLTAMLIAIAALSACGRVGTSEIGVRTDSLNKNVEMMEVQPGFYTAFLSDVDIYAGEGREISITLDNLTPKAGDNLTMADLDIEVYYTNTASGVAEMSVKYADRTVYFDGMYYAGYKLVQSRARDATYDAISQIDSLEIHKSRDVIRKAIIEKLQKILDSDDPGEFIITKVIIRNAKTDPTIEESIQRAVAKQKELSAKATEKLIAEQQVLINDSLTKSLTPQILMQKRLEVIEASCGKADSKCIIMMGDANMKMPQPFLKM